VNRWFLTSLLVLANARAASAQMETKLNAKAPQAAAEDGNSTAASPNVDGEVEQVYDKYEKEDTVRQQKEHAVRREREKAKPEITTLSDLGTLAPFEDIAVIQRRFLPKTNRYEAGLTGLTGLNNPFFNSLGLGFKGAYYFREKYGFELIYLYLGSSARQVTKNLEQNRSIATSSFVTPQGFFGAAFKWNPIYGKITFLNNRIVPFDINFSGGLGMTKTNAGREEPTLHLATSQVFAISKAWAVRWDLNWNFYNAQSTLSDQTSKSGTQTDLILALGVSFFFPEATYR
jgi:outer membrane beta-barrel protein